MNEAYIIGVVSTALRERHVGMEAEQHVTAELRAALDVEKHLNSGASSYTRQSGLLIEAERQRQIEAEGYDAGHDVGHADELALAAACYAIPPDRRRSVGIPGSDLWPWQSGYWKPTPNDRIRELVKAGALIRAALDALLADREQDAREQLIEHVRNRDNLLDAVNEYLAATSGGVVQITNLPAGEG